jgi:hypothetical protein
MNKFKLKTVDVWDTILRRDCHPDFIKRSTAYYFFLKFHSLHNVDSVDQLFTKRVETERLIGKKNKDLGYDDEYLIQDVMLQWVENYISAEQYDTPAIAHELYSWKLSKRRSTSIWIQVLRTFLRNIPLIRQSFCPIFILHPLI